MNTIRFKLISALALTSFLVGAVVLIMTPHMVEHEILEHSLEHRIDTFRKSIAHFVDEYGVWGSEASAKAFAHSEDQKLVAELTDLNRIQLEVALFDRNGHVLLPGPDHAIGDRVDIDTLDDPEEIRIKGEVFAYIQPIGEIPLSPWEEAYLHTLEETLIFSVLVAVVLILPFGIWRGTRLSSSLHHLIEAVNKMAEGKLQQQVPIRSKDEIGVLAQAFNSMNAQLVSAYHDLETSHNLIAEQAGRLKELSIRDELTGLYNRRYFNEESARMMSTSIRHRQPLSIVLGDIDHFKKINDNHSHATGDAVLKKVADILQREVRAGDLVARYGGEEMVLALPNTTLPEAAELLERIRERIADHPWHRIAEGLHVTMSFGLSADDSINNIEHQLERADAQLYRAKREGRNRVCALESV